MGIMINVATKAESVISTITGGLSLVVRLKSLWNAFRIEFIIAIAGIAMSILSYGIGHHDGAEAQKVKDAKAIAAAETKGIKAHAKVHHKVQTESKSHTDASMHHFLRD